jgi:hypothetical protein
MAARDTREKGPAVGEADTLPSAFGLNVGGVASTDFDTFDISAGS